MPSNKAIIGVALLAALGAAASLYFEPIAQRLAGTELGQRMLGAVLQTRAPAPPHGVIVAERGDIVPLPCAF